MYKGHVKDNELPIKPGDKITIKKGTEVHSYRPDRGKFTAGKTYKVTVDHIISGRTVTIAGRHKGDDQWRPEQQAEELAAWSRSLGAEYNKYYEYNTTMDDFPGLMAVAEERPAYFGNGRILVVHLSNPEVRWAGSSGYWTSVDINDVPEAQ